MAVDHAALKVHWQFLKNRTANELYAAFYIVTKQISQRLKEQKTLTNESRNYQAIAVPIIGDRPQDPAKNLEEAFEEATSSAHIKTGQTLFTSFSEAYKPTICSTRGVMGALLKGTVNTEEMPVLIATHLLVNHFSEEANWNEFVSVFAALLNQSGVEEFCSNP